MEVPGGKTINRSTKSTDQPNQPINRSTKSTDQPPSLLLRLTFLGSFLTSSSRAKSRKSLVSGTRRARATPGAAPRPRPLPARARRLPPVSREPEEEFARVSVGVDGVLADVTLRREVVLEEAAEQARNRGLGAHERSRPERSPVPT